MDFRICVQIALVSRWNLIVLAYFPISSCLCTLDWSKKQNYRTNVTVSMKEFIPGSLTHLQVTVSLQKAQIYLYLEPHILIIGIAYFERWQLTGRWCLDFFAVKGWTSQLKSFILMDFFSELAFSWIQLLWSINFLMLSLPMLRLLKGLILRSLFTCRFSNVCGLSENSWDI